eukprot:CAMPEP_0113262956 /NCGR_PEP_ID=MMETSP0008_2-20120614/18198_1 /TAXON_ID=97485 /ORGANISM="Prymnesium parvum" /LENGTH=56 /DNA_ID=CAMNT_0000111649 /DNA_START=159 /DNA_END=325 /DNA_ORIENTATION=- /assembly_acc=CAM_ASM_000153
MWFGLACTHALRAVPTARVRTSSASSHHVTGIVPSRAGGRTFVPGLGVLLRKRALA